MTCIGQSPVMKWLRIEPGATLDQDLEVTTDEQDSIIAGQVLEPGLFVRMEVEMQP